MAYSLKHINELARSDPNQKAFADFYRDLEG